MPATFNALPGIEVPVGAISKSFTKMWADIEAQGGPAPSSDDVKATQVNFVLHFGFSTTPADAQEQFQTVVRFSRRYPCRVVVLCPLSLDNPATELRAKVYGECHLGKSKGDTRCCEFVMLSYPLSARRFLENQVSVCFSTDLPLYYWVHRFSSSPRLNDYQYLLSRSRRVMFDTAIVPADAMTFHWPKPENVRDLVYARLLPVRQSIGQFLSAYSPELLVGGLKGIMIEHVEEFSAEARVLQSWLGERLQKAGAQKSLTNTTKLLKPTGEKKLSLQFDYDNTYAFTWQGNFTKGCATITANFGTGLTELRTNTSLLSPEAALGEAMFF